MGRHKKKTIEVTRGDKMETFEIKDDVEELAAANVAFKEENDRLQAEIAALRAINNPVIIPNRLESGDLQAGQDGVAEFVDGQLIKPEQKTLDDPNLIGKLQIEAFMNEMVTVHIAEVSDETDTLGFEIEVNGMKEVFRQGETKRVKRYFVEGLARAKKTRYTNMAKRQDDGDNGYVYPSRTGVRYPFDIVDDTQKGRQWCTAVLRQP